MAEQPNHMSPEEFRQRGYQAVDWVAPTTWRDSASSLSCAILAARHQAGGIDALPNLVAYTSE